MKNVTVKVITISSQLLVVTLFLTLVFSGGANNQNITIGNNNFDKMADKTMTLFKSEEFFLVLLILVLLFLWMMILKKKK